MGRKGWTGPPKSELEHEVCVRCGKSFVKGHQWEKHKNSCKKDKFQCVPCGKFYASDNSLWSHQQICDAHLEAVGKVRKSFKCALCDKDFPLSGRLSVHMATQHKPKDVLWPCSHSGCDRCFSKKRDAQRHATKKHVTCSDCEYSSLEKSMKMHRLTHEKNVLRCEHAPHCLFVCKEPYQLRDHESKAHVQCPVENCEYRALAHDLKTHLGLGRHTGDSAEDEVIDLAKNDANTASSSRMPPKAVASPLGSAIAETSTGGGETSKAESAAVPKGKHKQPAIVPIRIQGVKQSTSDTLGAYKIVTEENLALFKRAVQTSISYGDLAYLPNYLLPKLIKDPTQSDSSPWLYRYSAGLPMHSDYTLPASSASSMSPFFFHVTLDKSTVTPSLKGPIEDYDAFVQQWQEVMGITTAEMTILLSHDLSKPLFIQKMVALKFAEWNIDHARLWTPFIAFLAKSPRYAKTSQESGASDPPQDHALTLEEARSFDLQGQRAKAVARAAFEEALAALDVSPAAFLILTCAPGYSAAPMPAGSSASGYAGGCSLADRQCGPLEPLVWQVMNFRLKGGSVEEAYGHTSFPVRTGQYGCWGDYIRDMYRWNNSNRSDYSNTVYTTSMEEEFLRVMQALRPLSQLQQDFLTQEELAQVFIGVYTDGANLNLNNIASLPLSRAVFVERCRNVIQMRAGKDVGKNKGVWRVEDWTESDLRKLDILYQCQGSMNGALDYIGLWPGHTVKSLKNVIRTKGDRWKERSPAKLKELLRQEGIANEAEFLSLMTPLRVPQRGVELV